jgi:hypothetical protein
MTTIAKAANKTSRNDGKPSGVIRITEEGQYPLVNLSDVQIVERPEDAKNGKLFFNPRSPE